MRIQAIILFSLLLSGTIEAQSTTVLEKQEAKFLKKASKCYTDTHLKTSIKLIESYAQQQAYKKAFQAGYKMLEQPQLVWKGRESLAHIVRFRGDYRPAIEETLQKVLHHVQQQGNKPLFLKYWAKQHYTQMVQHKAVLSEQQEEKTLASYQFYCEHLKQIEIYYPSSSKEYLLFWDFVYRKYHAFPFIKEELIDHWLEKQDAATSAAAYRHVLYRAINLFKQKGAQKSKAEKTKQAYFQKQFRQYAQCTDLDTIHNECEQMPAFAWKQAITTALPLTEQQKISQENLTHYFQQQLRYPKSARNNRIEGEVELSFVLDTCGIARQIIIKKHPGEGCGLEAKRLVESMNSLMPGNGWQVGLDSRKKVAVKYHLTIPFQLKEAPKSMPLPPIRDFATAWESLWVIN